MHVCVHHTVGIYVSPAVHFFPGATSWDWNVRTYVVLPCSCVVHLNLFPSHPFGQGLYCTHFWLAVSVSVQSNSCRAMLSLVDRYLNGRDSSSVDWLMSYRWSNQSLCRCGRCQTGYWSTGAPKNKNTFNTFTYMQTHHARVYWDFRTSFAGDAQGCLDHRFREPTAYTAKLHQYYKSKHHPVVQI